MAIWTKANGNKIEINDLKATVAEARRLGWTKEGEEPKGLALDEMNREQLDKYASKRFGKKPDARKKDETLLEEIRILEEGTK